MSSVRDKENTCVGINFNYGRGFYGRILVALWIAWVAQLVRAPARKAGYPAWNPGPGENFSLKLTRQYLPEGSSEN